LGFTYFFSEEALLRRLPLPPRLEEAAFTTRSMTFYDDFLVTTAKFVAKSFCFTTLFGGSMTLRQKLYVRH